MHAVKDIAFGSIAGIVAEVFEYPFDLAKVRLQSQVLGNTARFGGLLDCLVQTWRGEGIRGLYRVSPSTAAAPSSTPVLYQPSYPSQGLPVPMFGAMAETAALFVAYSQLQNLIYWSTSSTSFRQLTLPERGLAAAGAGFLASFLATPIELVKCKMQVQMLAVPPRIPNFNTIPPSFVPATTIISTISPASTPRKPIFIARKLPGPIAIITNIVRTSGLKGLWVGHVGTMVRETGGTATWFASKELFASLLLARRTQYQSSLSKSFTPYNHSTELLPWESALSGALAGGVCVLPLYPADTVKSAIQTVEELHPPDKFAHSAHLTNKVGGFWETARAMYKAQGWRGLYAGCGMTVARAIPCSGIVFVIYDGLNQRYG
ncbi:mitochondrial carrier domain-containing protein [Lanmaoa asiatica]|nr:mitochondrial carrier domain-containing protein [Lanmaoa asiatica]